MEIDELPNIPLGSGVHTPHSNRHPGWGAEVAFRDGLDGSPDCNGVRWEKVYDVLVMEIHDENLLWFKTNGGRVGRVFPAISPGFLEAVETAERYTAADGSQIVAGIAPGQLHLYKVVEQEQTSAGVEVMCDYVGIGPPDTPLSAIPSDSAP
jgi:hypothetical protein